MLAWWRRSTLSGKTKPANAQRPGNGDSQDEELSRGYERGRWTLNASYQPRSSFAQGGDIWRSRRTWRRSAPPVAQRTPTRDMNVCATVQAPGNNTSRWSTRPAASWSRCPSATKWKAVRPLTLTGTYVSILLSRREASETSRHRISDTNAF